MTFAKTVGTGILLACSLVHLLQPGNAALTSVCVPEAFNTTYEAYAYLYCMLAFLVMQFVNNYLSNVANNRKYSGIESSAGEKVCQDCIEIVRPEMDIEAMVASTAAIAGTAELPNEEKGTHPVFLNYAVSLSVHEALMAEFSFNVHSVIIGLATGLASNDTLKALVIALSVHQLIEGIALGARLFSTDFGAFSDSMFTLMFACAAPAGMAAGVGMLAGSAINANGEAFMMAQGTLDSVTAGLLLHIAASKLIIDFPRDCTAARASTAEVLGLYFAVSIGAGFMAYLGVYL